jgi:hypothetical protein
MTASNIGIQVQRLQERVAELEAVLPDPYNLEACAFALDLLDDIARQMPDFYITSRTSGKILLSEAVGSDSDDAQQYLREYAQKIRAVVIQNGGDRS